MAKGCPVPFGQEGRHRGAHGPQARPGYVPVRGGLVMCRRGMCAVVTHVPSADRNMTLNNVLHPVYAFRWPRQSRDRPRRYVDATGECVFAHA